MHVYVYINSYISLYVYVYIYIHIYMHVYTYIYAYTRVYGKFCIETLHERHNRIQRLVVCLSEYLQERSRPLVSNITIFCHWHGWQFTLIIYKCN